MEVSGVCVSAGARDGLPPEKSNLAQLSSTVRDYNTEHLTAEDLALKSSTMTLVSRISRDTASSS